LYTARENKIVHFFVDNQWINPEKLYTPEESGHSVSLYLYNFVVAILPKKNRDIMVLLFSEPVLSTLAEQFGFVWRHLLKAFVVADIT